MKTTTTPWPGLLPAKEALKEARKNAEALRAEREAEDDAEVARLVTQLRRDVVRAVGKAVINGDERVSVFTGASGRPPLGHRAVAEVVAGLKAAGYGAYDVVKDRGEVWLSIKLEGQGGGGAA